MKWWIHREAIHGANRIDAVIETIEAIHNDAFIERIFMVIANRIDNNGIMVRHTNSGIFKAADGRLERLLTMMYL